MKTIYIVDDEESILKMLTHWCKNQWGYNVKTFSNGKDFLKSLNENPDLVLLDIMLPDINGNEILSKIKTYEPSLPVIMLSAQGSVEVALESIRLGAFDYFPKPIDKNRLESSVRNAIKNYDLERELKNLKEDIRKEFSFDNIISADKKMQEAFRMVSKVLHNDITVLIQGESGTGKELIARAIHYNGSRKDAPFVVVNCASIPRELLESELFGHEKGAFTGAHQRKIGKFELANGGTIFLDEIGEMDIALQAKILRVIQEKEFERVGGNEIIKTDVRIISATNRDLRECVEKKLFREDLYYRLSSFPITIPPLRERRGDIVVLIDHFIKKNNEKLGKNVKGVTKKALKLLYDYDWPGNVRELENTIERCIILTEGDYIDTDVLPPSITSDEISAVLPSNGILFDDNSPIIPLEKLKEEAIKHALKVTDGNIVEASKKLKIGRATLYRLMEKYNIDYKK
ncbi:two component, sigma54 specific, Fis family transcriptional regulator [Melioribacter roseus P3M-2]|uniref:Two component, sigma54 specific, Fis family transcriptional regulator n=1 Tax=Melioribacter roseus (strain DSM 23840 / JCM 17771 / VKM B-2668 / P3M-2) TaxID=1191523 RepID=I6Z5M9_MELRP|nr:sigma-54 dependent transcriptional regulator [Melioribacter roseus]AFN74465.1 two component, sigma54 specific, Fis family transcriptional regulator [Melioribacter roseus P3M-2]